MKKSCPGFSLLISALVLITVAVRAEEWIHYKAQPNGSKVRIDGTSTIHDWTVESTIIGGELTVDASFDADLKTVKTGPRVTVNIPVRSLTSNKPTMDNVMRDAMKQKEFPRIEYKLIELIPKPAAAGAAQFEAKGALTISGVTKTNTMPVTFERFQKNKLKITGTANLKMTDFGIKPPAPQLALGLIKTGDDVKITFEWLTAQQKDAAAQ